MKKRITYFDTYRFIAAMMIFLSHYIHSFSRVSFRYFHMMPYSIILEAVRGSLGVQMLCVILGYFAYMKGRDSKESLITLSLKRYVYFVVMAVVYYAIASTIGWLHVDGGFAHTVKVLAKEAVLLSDDYNGLFWTLIPMLIGSMFCYTLGRAKMGTRGILVVACAILLMKEPWVFNCTIGSFVAVWQNDGRVKRIWSHWYVQLVAIVVTFLPIRTEHESFRLYILQGVFCVVVLLTTMNNDTLRKIMGAPVWTKFNRSYFSLYIFHSLLYHHLGKKLIYADVWGGSFKIRFILVFLLLTILMVVLSRPIDKVVNSISKQLYKIIARIENKCNAIMSALA